MKKWNELTMSERYPYLKLGVEQGIYNAKVISDLYNKYADGGGITNSKSDKLYHGRDLPEISVTPSKDGNPYTVKKGDSFWKIANRHGISMADLMQYNPQFKGNVYATIHPGDVIYTDYKPKQKRYEYRDLDEIEAEEAEANKDNLSAIMAANHNGNFVVIDKKNHTMTVYDKDKNELAKTNQIITGLSGDDYNTVTYTDDGDNLQDGSGNMSTPAGITVISGGGTYHGVPSFTRARINSNGQIARVKDDKTDDIASSLHYGNMANLGRTGSNGCVRVDGKFLSELPNYIGVGTEVYTLPEKDGSRFEVREGKLNFFADNPYGIQEGDRRFWDDYNTTNNKSYSPLLISHKNVGEDAEYEGNIISYANAIMNGKKQLQKDFNLDSYTYDKLAQLAMGIAQQETKFNTSTRKQIKDYTPDIVLNIIRGDTNRSRGATQIKMSGDNKEMKSLYRKYGIDEDNIDNMDKSAIATMARLAYIYNSEVRGRHFKGADGSNISPYDALMYKWMGRNKELKNKTATPSDNIYIRNVKNYMKEFSFEVGREVEE